MKKDFDNWNKRKKGLDSREGSPEFYHQREVWWCAMGTNIGVEADGKGEEYSRPAVVLKGFNKNSFLAISLTGRKKDGDYYLYLGKVEDRDASANLSQIRIFDTKRLIKKIGMLEKPRFLELMDKIKSTLLVIDS